MPLPKREDVEFGIRRIIFGFFKKFFVADPVAVLVAQRYAVDAVIEGTDVIYLCLLLYIRIYMDFSAYSDMAIGIARLWGLRIPENFHFPFIATSPTAFWRRWHISLSTWIRDYIYIPLGGSSGSRARTALNLFSAMALCGLWHGSAWHFVLWGVAQGAFLICGNFAKRGMDAIHFRLLLREPGIGPLVKIVRTLGGWAATQTAVAFSWLLFFYPLSDVLRILKSLPVHPIIPQIF
jgi:alginate O-acetyltransferase complex protein AlgI